MTGGEEQKMTDLRGKRALVTGASSGIGAAVARRLAREGMDLILVARRRERLEALAQAIRAQGNKACVFAADLAQEEERARLCPQVGNVDVLINNAGLGWYGYGFKMPWQAARTILQVNIEAVAQLTLHFLQKMRQQGRGHIINIGSISGSLPSQGVAVYGASKSFLDNFTTALHRELSGTAVHVSVVRAGPVKTEFSDAALQYDHALHLPTEKVGVTAGQVAERIVGLLRHPRRVIYVPDWLRIVPFLELTFGWLIDRLGPLLLQRQSS